MLRDEPYGVVLGLVAIVYVTNCFAGSYTIQQLIEQSQRYKDKDSGAEGPIYTRERLEQAPFIARTKGTKTQTRCVQIRKIALNNRSNTIIRSITRTVQ